MAVSKIPQSPDNGFSSILRVITDHRQAILEITAGALIIPMIWLISWLITTAAGSTLDKLGGIALVILPISLALIVVIARRYHRRKFLFGMLGVYILNTALFVLLAMSTCPLPGLARGISALLGYPVWIWGEYLCY